MARAEKGRAGALRFFISYRRPQHHLGPRDAGGPTRGCRRGRSREGGAANTTADARSRRAAIPARGTPGRPATICLDGEDAANGVDIGSPERDADAGSTAGQRDQTIV